MAKVSRKMLKSFFANGSRPTEEKFASLIDSFVHGFEDSQMLGLAEFNLANTYVKGSTVIYKKAIYMAPTNVDTGIFNPKEWQLINGRSTASSVSKNTNSDKALKLLEKRILNNLTAKVDKLIYTKSGNLPVVDAKGNLTDSKIQKGDILTKGARAQDISVAAKAGLKSSNMQSTLERLQSEMLKMAATIEKLKQASGAGTKPKSTTAKKTTKPAAAKKSVKPVAKKSTKSTATKKAAKPKKATPVAAKKAAKPAATKKSGKAKQKTKSKKK